MKLLTIENLITYWRMFGSTEVPIPKGAETLIEDTIQALEEYKEILQKDAETIKSQGGKMSKSGEAFEKLTYEEIRSMTLKEVGEWYEKYLRDFGASDDMIERNTVVQALKCGVMPK